MFLCNDKELWSRAKRAVKAYHGRTVWRPEHSSDSSQIMSACQPGFARHVTSHAWLTADTAREAATGRGRRCNGSIWRGCCGQEGCTIWYLTGNPSFQSGTVGAFRQLPHANCSVGNASEAQCGFGILVSVWGVFQKCHLLFLASRWLTVSLGISWKQACWNSGLGGCEAPGFFWATR